MVLNHVNKQNQLMKVAENYIRDNPFNSNSKMLRLSQTHPDHLSHPERTNRCFTEQPNPNGSEHLLLFILLPISPLHWSCSSFSRTCGFIFCRVQQDTTHLVNTLVWVLITPRASLKFPFWIRHTTLHWSAVTSSLLICSTGGEMSFNTMI